MKKHIALIIVLAMLFCLSACSGGVEKKDDGFKVVATIYPIWDWVRSIAGGVEGVDIDLLLESGADLHSFQPTAADMVRVSDADMFICVGGESDKWVDDALAVTVNDSQTVIKLLELNGVGVEEETLAGMQGEEEEEEEEGALDEHVWLSPIRAKLCCAAIADALCAKLDETASAAVRKAADEYLARLDELDAEYKETVASAAIRTLLFADRYPFRYLADDYGLTSYAAFSGCSAETEASFETIAFLAGTVDRLGLKYIMVTESSDGSVAETVRNTTKSKDQTILTLDSIQAAVPAEQRDYVTYLSIMEENLKTLEKALNTNS